jgi:glycosyltransferase involved in cell wall biosynthesis
MINVLKPSAVVYGWPIQGTVVLKSDLYWEEGLSDDVIIHSLPNKGDIVLDYSTYKPDLIVSIGQEIEIKDDRLRKIHLHYELVPQGNELANEILSKSVFRCIDRTEPYFSIFTPTYETGAKRIYRLYNSLLAQTFKDWEWVIVDDSPSESTWRILNQIASRDYRVKIHRISPITGGNIGLVKFRAGMLCEGKWLVEMDHDDALISNCLELCHEASKAFREAGFMYTDCCELNEDGTFRTYDDDLSGNWYGRPGNGFSWGYAGHTLVEADGKEYIAHNTADINPRTIRFNIGMPNHARIWRKDIYRSIGGHNPGLTAADDLELIIRTFLSTRMIHIKHMLYLQYSNKNTTTNNNSRDINRKARLIRDYYNPKIHQRILDLGGIDWDWDEMTKTSPRLQNDGWENLKFGTEENILNYVYRKNL